jgi:GntR family transcriptional regulator
MTGPRFRELAAELRERVALGDHGPRGELESEAELGRRYAVSRVTVRRALEELREEGLVASRKGAGWYVVSGSIGQTLALGSFQHAGSALAAAGLDVRRRIVEYDFRPAPAEIAAQLCLAPDTEVLHARSVRYAGAEPLDTATEWVPGSVAAPISRADAEAPGIWASLRLLGHAVCSVRQSIAAVAATAPAAELLRVEPGTPALLIRRTAYTSDDTPLALSDHRYAGHRFRLDVEFRGWPGTTNPDPPGLNAVDSPEPD